MIIDINLLGNQQTSYKEEIKEQTPDEYLLHELRDGKRAYFNFTDSQDDMVHLYDKQEFQDWQDYLNMQKQMDDHQKNQFSTMRQLLTKSEKSLLSQKLQQIMWEDNQSSKQNNDMNSQFYNDQLRLIRDQRRQDIYVKSSGSGNKLFQDTSEIQQNQLNRLARIKKKADNYIIQKFKHTGFMVQTLSKTIKLKPIKLPQLNRSKSPPLIDQQNLYQFNELRQKQTQFTKKVYPFLGRKNRDYLEFDLQQIHNYVDLSLN